MVSFRAIFTYLFIVGISALPQAAGAAPDDVACPAGSNLNQCVAQACQNPNGGRVLLKAGTYDGNLTAALNGFMGTASCSGGISIIGKGMDKTYLVSNGPNLLPNGTALNWAVGIGFGLAQMGPVEIKDLTISCRAPGSCPLFGASMINAESAHATNVKFEGFIRGIHGASSNLTIEKSILTGIGDDVRGRGIFIVHPLGTRMENVTLSKNIIADYWRGMVVDTVLGATVSKNAMFNLSEGMLVQNVDGDLDVSQNVMESTETGIIALLGVYHFDEDLGDFVFDGSTPGAEFSKNMIVGSLVGIQLDFLPYDTEVTIDKNVILGTDSALALLDAYDPCLHDVMFEKNIVLPLSSLPDLGSCQP